MDRKVVLAIDLGTTGNRVIAFSKQGEIVARSYYEFHQYFPRPGWVEHSPREILGTTIKALKDVLRIVGTESVVSIGITNQRETTILWDRESGEPVYNAIVWQDKRSESICEELGEYKEVIRFKTGLFLDPYFSASKIKWLLENVEGLKNKVKQGKIILGTPEVWILWNLTGGRVFATEPSNASRTLLFNIRELKFDPLLLKIFEIPDGILPEVRDSDSLFGYVDKRVAGKEIPICGILGDQQASLFAHCGWEEGVVKNTYGTGLFIMTNTQANLIDSGKLLTSVAWKFKNKINYALEGSVFMGGAVIQWLRDNLKILKSAADSEKMAEVIGDNEGVYFIPALQGFGAPYWLPKAGGAILGLTRRSSRETIVRAALESLAYQTRDVIEEMRKELKTDFKVLRVDGGACLNDFLMQFQADILGMKIERPRIIDTTALGAAGISGVASGFWSIEEFEGVRRIDKEFRPILERNQADFFYIKWKKSIKKIIELAEEI